MLRVCTSAWEEQYYLLHQYLPTKLSSIRDTLKEIEKVQATKKCDSDTARPRDKGGAKQKTRFASDSTKHKQGGGNEVCCIPRKRAMRNSGSAARSMLGPTRLTTPSNTISMPKMACYNLPTLRHEKALTHVEATTERKNVKTSRS